MKRSLSLSINREESGICQPRLESCRHYLQTQTIGSTRIQGYLPFHYWLWYCTSLSACEASLELVHISGTQPCGLLARSILHKHDAAVYVSLLLYNAQDRFSPLHGFFAKTAVQRKIWHITWHYLRSFQGAGSRPGENKPVKLHTAHLQSKVSAAKDVLSCRLYFFLKTNARLGHDVILTGCAEWGRRSRCGWEQNNSCMET